KIHQLLGARIPRHGGPPLYAVRHVPHDVGHAVEPRVPVTDTLKVAHAAAPSLTLRVPDLVDGFSDDARSDAFGVRNFVYTVSIGVHSCPPQLLFGKRVTKSVQLLCDLYAY